MAKNTPQRVQTGIQYARIHRAPLDSEEVLNTFSELQDKVEQKGNCETKSGSFYAGLYTAVIDDDNASYNGPYYISYITHPGSCGMWYCRKPIQGRRQNPQHEPR